MSVPVVPKMSISSAWNRSAERASMTFITPCTSLLCLATFDTPGFRVHESAVARQCPQDLRTAHIMDGCDTRDICGNKPHRQPFLDTGRLVSKGSDRSLKNFSAAAQAHRPTNLEPAKPQLDAMIDLRSAMLESMGSH
jgi:hypothetical protein